MIIWRGFQGGADKNLNIIFMWRIGQENKKDFIKLTNYVVYNNWFGECR